MVTLLVHDDAQAEAGYQDIGASGERCQGWLQG